ncbi:hypothetical protein [Kribbella catacumbae]|uniref:hypothetical protein n=1 Tax=Kribbella catacumbae TaxID=460086 RepID=UPI000361FBE7|nr:hypothetical protein [Kribbella catacumbae]
MNLPGKRLLLGTAVAAAALGVGGFAYAAGNDPAPDQGYVTVEDSPAPSTDPSTGPSQGSQGTAQRDGRDCPEKNGSGQAQPEQTQPEQTQPEQQADPQSNA